MSARSPHEVNSTGDSIDRSPARLSAALAIGAAVIALATVGTASLVSFSLAAIGTATVAGGIVASNRGLVTAGAVVLFVGTLAAGVADASAIRLLVATGGAVFAWDVGRAAVDVGVQLGAGADTTDLELVHAGASLLVIVLSGGVGYVLFQTAAGGQPVSAVVALLIAGTLLSLTLE
jgi:hypothetical protein